jgi:hypothetical protein
MTPAFTRSVSASWQHLFLPVSLPVSLFLCLALGSLWLAASPAQAQAGLLASAAAEPGAPAAASGPASAPTPELTSAPALLAISAIAPEAFARYFEQASVQINIGRAFQAACPKAQLPLDLYQAITADLRGHARIVAMLDEALVRTQPVAANFVQRLLGNAGGCEGSSFAESQAYVTSRHSLFLRHWQEQEFLK